MSRFLHKFASLIHGIASLIRWIASLIIQIGSAELIRGTLFAGVTVSEISVWHVTKEKNTSIRLKDRSSLDAIARQLPEGYYSTFRTFAGGTRVLGLTSHLRRLYEPVPKADVDESLLRRQLSHVLEAYRSNEARVRAIITRQGQVYLAIAPLMPFPRAIYEEGVRVETTELFRDHPHLKSTAFIGRSDAERKHIAEAGIFEALLVKRGKILEGMTSNFFYILQQDGLPPHLLTARAGILPGVTRETVIAIARGRKLQVK